MAGFHGHFADKSQGAFAAGHQVGDNIEWVVEGYERQQVESGYVFYGVFVPDALCEFAVAAYFVAQGIYAAQELGVAVGKVSARLLAAGVEYGAVGHNQAWRQQHAVGVGMYAAVHA